jgi:DHA2 family multidrug resistance protein
MLSHVDTTHGLDVAQHTGLTLLDGSVRLQSAVISFGDTFFATAALTIAAMPLILLLGKSDSSKAAEPAH